MVADRVAVVQECFDELREERDKLTEKLEAIAKFAEAAYYEAEEEPETLEAATAEITKLRDAMWRICLDAEPEPA